MKIIALSDTHIKFGSIKDRLPGDLVEMLKKADLILHAGDFVRKKAYNELSAINRLEAVHGNMDEPELKNMLPERKVIEIEGIKIGLIHQAALSLQDTIGARYMAKEMGADVLVFGHIHRPVIEKSDVLLACPGSPTAPRMSDPSAIELDIEGGKISGKILTFEGTQCGAQKSFVMVYK
ncbi:phosphodiesterase [groundwater metagenome]